MLEELERAAGESVRGNESAALAAEMVPDLRASAAETDRLARLPDHIIQGFEARGLTRLLCPVEYGGRQLGPRDFMDTMVAIGRGDMSAAWALAILNGCASLIPRTMPKHVCDEVFATEGGPRIAGVFYPRSLKARPQGDGVYIEEGLWAFNSGVRHANWDLLGVPIYNEAGEVVDEGMALIPITQVEILDDWDTMALRGTGSNMVRVRDVFVERDWIQPFGRMRRESLTEARYRDTWQYRTTPSAEGSIHLTYSGIGAAEAALEYFISSVGKGGIQYTQYSRKSEAPVIHVAAAEASARIDAAKAIAYRAVDRIEEAARAGELIDPTESSRIRRDAGFVTSLLFDAVDRLSAISGGSFIGSRNLLARCWRDLRGGTLHGAITPPTVMENYGRLLCGLPSNITMAGVAAPVYAAPNA